MLTLSISVGLRAIETQTITAVAVEALARNAGRVRAGDRCRSLPRSKIPHPRGRPRPIEMRLADLENARHALF